MPPRARPRRQGLRPAEARADERDPRPVAAGRRSVFGCQAPDSGNAEIIAHYGTDEQKEKYLAAAARRRDRVVLLDDRAAGRLRPGAVQVPGRAKDGDEWVIDGEKWFSSNFALRRVRDRDGGHRSRRLRCTRARRCSSCRPTRRASRSSATSASRVSATGEGSHAYVRYNHVRVPAENLLGGEGQAFVIAQTRLGGGRIHHAMRTIGVCQGRST